MLLRFPDRMPSDRLYSALKYIRARGYTVWKFSDPAKKIPRQNLLDVERYIARLRQQGGSLHAMLTDDAVIELPDEDEVMWFRLKYF